MVPFFILTFTVVLIIFAIVRGRGGTSARGPNRKCPRCLRVDRLEAYEDGRTTIHICRMCRAEMELLRSPSIKL